MCFLKIDDIEERAGLCFFGNKRNTFGWVGYGITRFECIRSYDSVNTLYLLVGETNAVCMPCWRNI